MPPVKKSYYKRKTPLTTTAAKTAAAPKVGSVYEPSPEMVEKGKQGWCIKCRLCEVSPVNKLMGVGPAPTLLMFVGEAPGTQEAAAKAPFIGPSGMLLNQTLAQFGIHRGQVFVTNTCRCQPVPTTGPSYDGKRTSTQRLKGKENRVPKADEVAACLPYLEDEVARVQPNVIVALGATAAKALLSTTSPITDIRGQIFWSDKYNAKIIPTLHPAALLHAQKFRPSFRRDVKLAIDEAVSKITQKKVSKTDVKLFREGQCAETVQALEDLLQYPAVSVDVETSDFDAYRGFVVCIAFSGKEGTAISIRIRDSSGKLIWTEEEWKLIHQAMHKLLKSPSVKIAQNAKFEMHHLHHMNLSFGPHLADTQVMHHFLDMDAEHDLETLASLYTDMPSFKSVIEKYKEDHPEAKISYAFIPFEVLGPYNGSDTDATLRIYNIFHAQMQDFKVPDENGDTVSFNVLDPFLQLTMPALRVVWMAEKDGARIDWPLLKKRHEQMSFKLEGLVKKFKDAAGDQEINPNSPKQLQVLFFEKLKLPTQKPTATGQSTDDEVLSKLAPLHAAPAALWEYREWNKKHSTYIEGIRDAILFGQTTPRPLEGQKKADLAAFLDTLWDDEALKKAIESGRVKTDWNLHPQFHFTGTRTGRLSSSNPVNAQNMPKGPLIRHLFISKYEGGQIIEGDLNQGELRVFASEAKDAKLIDFFQRGVDVHKLIAGEVFGKAAEEITDDERGQAKAVAFGTIYGRTEYSLADTFGWTIDESVAFLNRFFNKFTGVSSYIDVQHELARRRGWVKTIFGRIRTIEDINSPDKAIRKHAENQSINAPIQSACSDITMAAAVRIYGELRARNMRTHLFLTVHDSIMYDSPKDEVEVAVKLIKEQMEIPVPGLLVPMVADVKYGDRWASNKPDEPI